VLRFLFLLIGLMQIGFARPMVYDCFLFYNELDVLKIRLEEMYPYVDHFVLLECTESFQGHPKPLYYEENKQLFEKYQDKIIHVVVKDHFPSVSPWPREFFQRNQILRGLKKASPQDIVILSDVDEILRGSDVARFIAPLLACQTKATVANQRFYRWYCNRLNADTPFWLGSVAVKAKFFRKTPPDKVWFHKAKYLAIHDVGWHFSNMGGLKTYIEKLAGFSHPEANTEENRDPKNIFNTIQASLQLVPIDQSFPQILQDNESFYRELGFLDYEGNPAYF
jgi:beta-1,4-mannosyl-glycoprotein beta-1,4-N-acetylglucosaminyltransferase